MKAKKLIELLKDYPEHEIMCVDWNDEYGVYYIMSFRSDITVKKNALYLRQVSVDSMIDYDEDYGQVDPKKDYEVNPLDIPIKPSPSMFSPRTKFVCPTCYTVLKDEQPENCKSCYQKFDWSV